MNTAQLSEEAKQVLKSHVGYRSEATEVKIRQNLVTVMFVSSLFIFLIQKSTSYKILIFLILFMNFMERLQTGNPSKLMNSSKIQ